MFFFFQAEDGIRDADVTVVQTCALPIYRSVLFCADPSGRREALKELLGRIKVAPKEFASWQEFRKSNSKLGILVAPLETGIGFEYQDSTLFLITENQLFGQRICQTRRRQRVGFR